MAGGQASEQATRARFFRHGDLRTLGLYLWAGVSYVTVGVFVNELILSWVEGFAWLLLWVWVAPALVRRVRR